MSEIILDDMNFEDEVINSDIPVVVDFWATWCGPCQMFGPVLAEFAEENEGKIKVGKVNVDEQPKLAMEFRVASIPTVLLFKDGEVVNQSVGFMPKEKLEEFVK